MKKIIITIGLCYSSIFAQDSVKAFEIGHKWVWMAEDLNVDTFRNGDKIHLANSDSAWIWANVLGLSAYRYINDDSTLGKLYNWAAVNDVRGLASKKWRVPTMQDFKELRDTLGGPYLAGKNFKSLLNFKLDGSVRTEGYFTGYEQEGTYWTANTDPNIKEFAIQCYLLGYTDNLLLFGVDKNQGNKVRLIEDKAYQEK